LLAQEQGSNSGERYNGSNSNKNCSAAGIAILGYRRWLDEAAHAARL
jgi:hypothetical protein